MGNWSLMAIMAFLSLLVCMPFTDAVVMEMMPAEKWRAMNADPEAKLLHTRIARAISFIFAVAFAVNTALCSVLSGMELAGVELWGPLDFFLNVIAPMLVLGVTWKKVVRPTVKSIKEQQGGRAAPFN